MEPVGRVTGSPDACSSAISNTPLRGISTLLCLYAKSIFADKKSFAGAAPPL
jgi:hypothetical protein